MSKRLHLTVDPSSVSVAAAIRVAAEAAPLLIVSGRALADLTRELGGHEAAATFLLELAEAIGKPVALNMPTGRGAASTMFLSPRDWTAERLSGWVGGHHQELEQQFGRVSRMGADPGRRNGDRR